MKKNQKFYKRMRKTNSKNYNYILSRFETTFCSDFNVSNIYRHTHETLQFLLNGRQFA